MKQIACIVGSGVVTFRDNYKIRKPNIMINMQFQNKCTKMLRTSVIASIAFGFGILGAQADTSQSCNQQGTSAEQSEVASCDDSKANLEAQAIKDKKKKRKKKKRKVRRGSFSR